MCVRALCALARLYSMRLGAKLVMLCVFIEHWWKYPGYQIETEKKCHTATDSKRIELYTHTFCTRTSEHSSIERRMCTTFQPAERMKWVSEQHNKKECCLLNKKGNKLWRHAHTRRQAHQLIEPRTWYGSSEMVCARVVCTVSVDSHSYFCEQRQNDIAHNVCSFIASFFFCFYFPYSL